MLRFKSLVSLTGRFHLLYHVFHIWCTVMNFIWLRFKTSHVLISRADKSSPSLPVKFQTSVWRRTAKKLHRKSECISWQSFSIRGGTSWWVLCILRCIIRFHSEPSIRQKEPAVVFQHVGRIQLENWSCDVDSCLRSGIDLLLTSTSATTSTGVNFHPEHLNTPVTLQFSAEANVCSREEENELSDSVVNWGRAADVTVQLIDCLDVWLFQEVELLRENKTSNRTTCDELQTDSWLVFVMFVSWGGSQCVQVWTLNNKNFIYIYNTVLVNTLVWLAGRCE